MASEGDLLGILAVQEGQIVYRRFDDKGNKQGAKVDLSSDPPANLALGAADGDALAVWGVPGRMRARGLVHGEIAGEAFDFGVGTIDNYFTASIAPTDDRFAIAWNGNPTPGEFRTMFVTATLDGDLSVERELVHATMAHRVSKLARTATGYALLLNADTVPPTPVVVILDDKGTVTGAAHRFLGATFGWDLAVLGDELGLIARRATGEIAFRSLDAEGAPLAAWRCVTTPSEDLYQSAGIDADEDGYALLYRTPEGAEALSIVDRLGSAQPM